LDLDAQIDRIIVGIYCCISRKNLCE